MKGRFVTGVIFFLNVMVWAQGEPISPIIMGQNYWYVEWPSPFNTTPKVFSIPINQTNTVWPAVSATSRLVRIGGKSFNIGNAKPQAGQEIYYVSIVDDIRKNDCEPVLTLPFLLSVTNSVTSEPNVGDPVFDQKLQESITTASTILHYVNVIHKRNVRFIVLGNEPDLDYKWSKKSPFNLSAAQIASNIAGYIKPMADAVRQMSATVGPVKIIGPEYTHCLPEVYDLLFTPTNTATYIGGKSPVTDQPYLDYASVHLYGPEYEDAHPESSSYSPPLPSQAPWTASLTFCNIEKYAKDWIEPTDVSRRYRGAMHYMKRKVAESTPQRSGFAPLGWMVTEMNSGHTITNTEGTDALSDGQGHDGISMQGAQNLARMYALAMEYGAASVMMWSVKESGQNDHQDRGYLVGAATNAGDVGKKRPSWFHYKMLADYFKGTYYRDERMANHASNSSSSGGGQSIAGFDANPNSSYSSPDETRGPEWLHFKNSTSHTISLGPSTYALGNGTAFNSHLEEIFETKAFAAAGANIAVMVLNHSSSQQDVAIRFSNNNTFTNSGATKKFRFNIPSAYHSEIYFNQSSGTNSFVAANATDVFIFNCSGSLLQRYTYTESDHASTYNKTFSLTANNGTPDTFTSTVSTPVPNCFPNTGCNITGSSGYSNYVWFKPPALSPVGSGSVLTGASPGIYQIIASSGCGTVATSVVVHQNSPLVDAGESVAICGSTMTAMLGNTLLATSAYGGYTYTWQPVGTTGATINVNQGTAVSSKFFTLVAGGGGCNFEDPVFVDVKDDFSVMIKDHYSDVGLAPGQYTATWVSPDIWCNYTNGTVNVSNIDITPSTTGYPKVRVHNNGCDPIPAGEVTVSLYYSVAHLAASWSTSWINFGCAQLFPFGFCANTPTGTCGSLIGNVSNTVAIPPGGSAVVQFTWAVPPNMYCAVGGPKKTWMNTYFPHWSLQAHVTHTADLLPTLSSNVYSNNISNNVALRNILIIEPSAGGGVPAGIYVKNAESNDQSYMLQFVSLPDYNDESMLNYAEPVMFFQGSFLDTWVSNGEVGEGIVPLSDTSVQIISENAYMDHFNMGPGVLQPIGLSVFPTADVDLSGGNTFGIDVVQRPDRGNGPMIGGFRYLVSKEGWRCDDCGDGGGGQRRAFSSSVSDTVVVSSDLVIGSSDSLHYTGKVLRFYNDVGVTIQAGGVLRLKNCVLEAACKQGIWRGIDFTGDSLQSSSLAIEACNFRDTDTPLQISDAAGVSISDNSFVGLRRQTGTGIVLRGCGNFDISRNHIARFGEGITTRGTFTTQGASNIERNVIQLVANCVRSTSDNHVTTTMRCNSFKYEAYAILADSSQLNDFGSALEGAGNRFKSNSTALFHRVFHQNGNSPTYFYSSKHPDSTAMTVLTAAASNDRLCYPGDSLISSSRIASAINEIRTEIPGIRAIPNPGSDQTVIEVNLAGDPAGKIRIHDAQGRLLVILDVSAVRNRLLLDLTQMAKGIYFISLQTENGAHAHTKLLVQD